MRVPYIDITEDLYLNGIKVSKISKDSSAARSDSNLITEKAIKDYMDGNSSATEVIVQGETLTIGDLIYLANDSKWYKADNLVEDKIKTELRILKTSTTAYISGLVGAVGLTPGNVYYVGTNGGITDTIPETEGIFQRKIGTALSATLLEFLPDQTYIEITLDGSGAGSTFTTSEIAGETISSGKIVYSLAGKMYKFDPANINIYGRAFGLSKSSGVLDGAIQIQWSGKFYEAGLSLTQDQYYYAGTNGLPTTDVTGFNLIQPIGFSVDANNLMINFTTAFLTT